MIKSWAPVLSPQMELWWLTCACPHLEARCSSFCVCQEAYLRGKWTSWHCLPGPDNVLHPSCLHQLSVLNFFSEVWSGLGTGSQMDLLRSRFGWRLSMLPYTRSILVVERPLEPTGSRRRMRTGCPLSCQSLISRHLLPRPRFHSFPCTSVFLAFSLSKYLSLFQTVSLTHRTLVGLNDKMNIWV